MPLPLRGSYVLSTQPARPPSARYLSAELIKNEPAEGRQRERAARGRKMVFVSANDHQEWSASARAAVPSQGEGERGTTRTQQQTRSTKMNDVRWNFHEISAFMTFGKFWRGSLWDGNSDDAANDAIRDADALH